MITGKALLVRCARYRVYYQNSFAQQTLQLLLPVQREIIVPY